MIDYKKYILDNGLTLIVHKDSSTPLAVMNVLYDVGTRDEDPGHTGFAHLFEHLMFGGSKNIPDYDKQLQLVGGDNNAFTSPDITNYYLTLPAENIETGFWLESDRMLSLAFSEKSLEVQRNVVIEEFNQRYLNQPYGDLWMLMRPLAYHKHPYQWNTIGKEPAHIENATMQQVKDFFFHHYAPNNAIISIAGNVEGERMKELADKWFLPIEKRNIPKRNIPIEPEQKEPRYLEVEREVPHDMIMKCYHMCDRSSPDYYPTDLLSDILANGDSSRFNQKLVKEREIFSNLDAYIMGSFDPGLFIISGTPNEGYSLEDGEKAIQEELNFLLNKGITEDELEKVKNKVEANTLMGNESVMNLAMRLGYYELLGDVSLINHEVDRYREVSNDQIIDIATRLFDDKNCSTLYYKAKKD